MEMDPVRLVGYATSEIIAKRIIAIARTGERDPDRLCDSALASIGLSKQTTGEDR